MFRIFLILVVYLSSMRHVDGKYLQSYENPYLKNEGYNEFFTTSNEDAESKSSKNSGNSEYAYVSPDENIEQKEYEQSSTKISESVNNFEGTDTATYESVTEPDVYDFDADDGNHATADNDYYYYNQKYTWNANIGDKEIASNKNVADRTANNDNYKYVSTAKDSTVDSSENNNAASVTAETVSDNARESDSLEQNIESKGDYSSKLYHSSEFSDKSVKHLIRIITRKKFPEELLPDHSMTFSSGELLTGEITTGEEITGEDISRELRSKEENMEILNMVHSIRIFHVPAPTDNAIGYIEGKNGQKVRILYADKGTTTGTIMNKHGNLAYIVLPGGST